MKRQPASELQLGCFPVPNDRGGCQPGPLSKYLENPDRVSREPTLLGFV
ncbi:MAG: hypothetical protein O4859_23190 [Trichodesmium sp. St18_bin1]|nr:hypothetical protein [Trichodesmium sp. St18_bin1]